MKITDILNKDLIKIKMIADSKDDLLNKMMVLAENSGKIIDSEDARSEVFERESIMSTGVGKGIALPHAKTNSISSTVGALAIMKEPMDYDALDGNPVNIVFLLLGTENNVGNHLRLLSKISRLMNNDTFRAHLTQAQSTEEIMDLFVKAEDQE
jgi:PTS system fructose-specific IIC component